MPASRELLTVLYDPASYCHRWRSAAVQLSPVQRSALNSHLVRSLRLAAYQPPPRSQAVLVHRLVALWPHLPAAAYLLACAKLRAPLTASREYMRLPSAAHAFMQLGFAPDEAASSELLSRDVLSTPGLVGWGGRYLRQLSPQVPPWLAERLSLLFDASLYEGHSALPAHGSADPASFDLICFWRALAHAAHDTELVHHTCR